MDHPCLTGFWSLNTGQRNWVCVRADVRGCFRTGCACDGRLLINPPLMWHPRYCRRGFDGCQRDVAGVCPQYVRVLCWCSVISEKWFHITFCILSHLTPRSLCPGPISVELVMDSLPAPVVCCPFSVCLEHECLIKKRENKCNNCQ